MKRYVKSNDFGMNPSRFLTQQEFRAVQSRLNHNLPEGARYARVTEVRDVDDDGYGTVEYELTWELPYYEYDDDGLLHKYFGEDTEYLTERMKVR